MNKVINIDELFIYYADGKKEPTTFEKACVVVNTCRKDLEFYDRLHKEVREEYIETVNTALSLKSRSIHERAAFLSDYMAEAAGKIVKTQVLLTQAEVVLNIINKNM